MIIFLIGDSITQGYWDSKGGWADRIKAEVFKRDIESDFHYYHGVHNLGIDGNTTTQVIERFDNETKARFWHDSDYGVVIAVGTNDTVIDRSGNAKSDPGTYRQQLEVLNEKASLITKNIAFINLLPVDERFTSPLPSSSTGKSYTNDRINEFNKVLEAVCSSNNVELIDVRSKYLDSDFPKLLSDGLHPNDEGHALIYQTVMPKLENWLYPRS